MIPASFRPAAWRGTTKASADGYIGVSFDEASGEVIRLKISVESAKQLRDSLAFYLSIFQSERSGEIPSSPGSIPDEGEN